MGKNAKTLASISDGVKPWETSGSEVTYRAALESIVLLENDGVLPLQPGKVALFGAGGRQTVKGGTGSGEVNERRSISIEEGLEAAGFHVTTKAWLDAYDALEKKNREDYTRNFQKRLYALDITSIINFMSDPYCPPVGQPVTEQDIAASDTDTCIYVVARQAGEGSDRKLSRNEYSLTPEEKNAIASLAEAYERMIVIINVGGVFDMGFLEEISGINAVLFYAQQGGMGGRALADLLSGEATPSGKLTDTWARRYEDYPSAMEFSYLNGNLEEEYYNEGIYVGYRWFDTFGIMPQYPFGYGLSYTAFSVDFLDISMDDGMVRVRARVTNTGSEYPGKEVVQLYASCPQSPLLPKEYQRLVAFAKTGELGCGDSEIVTMLFPPEVLSSYRTEDAVTVLERGDYILRLGNSSRWNTPCACIRVEEELIVSRHDHICPPARTLRELTAPILNRETVPEGLPRILLEQADLVCRRIQYRKEACETSEEEASLLKNLSDSDCLELVVGGGMAGKRYYDAPGAAGSTTSRLIKKGVPNILLADGPAGVRLQRRSVLLRSGKIKPVEPGIALMNDFPKFIRSFLVADPSRGQVLYQFATAFPVELALAQTWNRALLQEVGKAVGQQMEAYGVSCWLAPALNIHRNPLCGRNFEYFSEDPLLSGVFAADLTQGVQSVAGHYVTLKHFACNNQEDNRNRTNANVSERALREIYLKGFEIAVRLAHPGAVMSSYNRLNGTYTPNSYDLLTRLLRCEWGFDGVVMTDWFSTGKGLADSARCIRAGNDLLMPGTARDRKKILCAIQAGQITRDEVRRCAANVLRLICRTEQYKRFRLGK